MVGKQLKVAHEGFCDALQFPVKGLRGNIDPGRGRLPRAMRLEECRVGKEPGMNGRGICQEFVVE